MHGGLMNEVLRELIIIYGATTISSLVCNQIYFKRKNKEAFTQSKRKLKYRNLCTKCSLALDDLEKEYKMDNLVSDFLSVVPVLQVINTVANIIEPQEDLNKSFDEGIEYINKEELIARREFLTSIKEAKFIPIDIKLKLEDEDYLPSEEEHRYVMKLNFVVKKLNEKYKDEIEKILDN